MSTKRCMTKFVGTAEQDAKLREQIAALKDDNSLVQILQAAQEIYGYLPEEVIQVIASEMGVSTEAVYSVATFYSQFNFNPKGRYAISVCLGTACYVKGAGDIYEALKKKLNIGDGETTADGKFSLDACRCVGACSQAPVIVIDEVVHGRVTPNKFPQVIKKLQDNIKEGAAV